MTIKSNKIRYLPIGIRNNVSLNAIHVVLVKICVCRQHLTFNHAVCRFVSGLGMAGRHLLHSPYTDAGVYVLHARDAAVPPVSGEEE